MSGPLARRAAEPSQVPDEGGDGSGDEAVLRWGHTERRSPIRRTADVITLIGVGFLPLYGLGFAGASWGDLILGLAVLVRGLQMAAEGLNLRELRSHGYLLVLFGVFAVGGAVSGFAIESPMPWEFIRVLIATLGTIAVIAVYGSTERELIPVLRAFGIGCVVLALSGLFGEQTDGRATGFSIHPNGLAHSVLLGTFACLYLARVANQRREQILWGAAAVTCAMAILLVTGSRGTFLGLGVGAVLYLLLDGDRRVVLGTLAVTYVTVVLLALGVVALPASNPISRLQGGGDAALSDREREQALSSDWRTVGEAPVFGEGFEDASLLLVHNVYLQAWVAGGAVCALCIMLLGATMLALPLGQRRRHLPLACGAAGVAVAWLFTPVFTPRDQWVFLILVFRLCDPLALARWGTRRDEELAEASSPATAT